jgi:hypothetical protein
MSMHPFGCSTRTSIIKPKLPPRFQAFKGEVSRLVLIALRKSTKPVPLSDLTLVVAGGRGINPDDKPFMRVLSRRVRRLPSQFAKKGLVEMTRPPGSLGLWEITNL